MTNRSEPGPNFGCDKSYADACQTKRQLEFPIPIHGSDAEFVVGRLLSKALVQGIHSELRIRKHQKTRRNSSDKNEQKSSGIVPFYIISVYEKNRGPQLAAAAALADRFLKRAPNTCRSSPER